jgi:FkbM family methyltransferase
MKTVRVCGHSFIPELVNENGIVMDCGANIGSFSKWMSVHFPFTKIYAFEPDPDFFRKMSPRHNVIKHNIAMSSISGHVQLRLGENRCSSIRFTEHTGQPQTTVLSTTVDEFCSSNDIAYVDLIKLDIEGAEISVLSHFSESRLNQVGQITVEFHDFIQKSDLVQIREITRRLINIGFYCLRFSYFDHSDVLFISKNIYHLSLCDIFRLHYDKYRRGISRRLNQYLLSQTLIIN